MNTAGRLAVLAALVATAFAPGCASFGAASSADGGAGGDGGDGGDAGAAFCSSLATTPTFCCDFDTVTDFAQQGWTAVEPGVTPGSLSLATDEASSPPRSLHTVTDVDPNTRGASLVKGFTVRGHLEVDFDVLFKALPPPGTGADQSVFSTLTVEASADATRDLYFYVGAGGAYFQQGPGTQYSTSLAWTTKPALGAWHHVTLSVTLAAGTTTVSATVDGFAAWSSATLDKAWAVPNAATVRLGVPTLYRAQHGESYVDNVLMTVD